MIESQEIQQSRLKMADLVNDHEVEAALQRCRDTCGELPCYLPEYLAARRAYHLLLVRAGLLTREAADNDATSMRQGAFYKNMTDRHVMVRSNKAGARG